MRLSKYPEYWLYVIFFRDEIKGISVIRTDKSEADFIEHWNVLCALSTVELSWRKINITAELEQII